MANLLVVASRPHDEPHLQIVHPNALRGVVEDLEGWGYEVFVHKITAPIPHEALDHLMGDR